MTTWHATTGKLRDSRILVVEDEPILAMEMQFALEDEGADVVGPASTLKRAMILAADEDLSAAVLDIRLGPDAISPVARVLWQRSVPFFFYSGQPKDDPVCVEWPGAELIRKPTTTMQLVDAVANLLGRPH
jgi:DNA-binding response OmpR family regulator